LARSLSYRPKILLLDEPLSNLDAKLRLRLRADLRRIIKQTGLTALYVTHDQSEAVVLGDQIGVMNQGELLQLGSPQKIYNQPSSLFVASFTGASNTLHGTVMNRDGADYVVELTHGTKIRTRSVTTMSQGETVAIAVRPENISLATYATQWSLPVRVRQLQFLGVQTNYEIEVFNQTLEVTELGTSPRFEVGAEVFMTLLPEQCWSYPT
jgi:iron(III) transport system ATP-binding protein